MTVWLTSDLHLGHLRILEICPKRTILGSTVDEHDEELIRRFNSVVQPNDTVIILGDLIMGKKFVNAPKYLPRLAGNKILLCGNHDWMPNEDNIVKITAMEKLYTSYGYDIHYGLVSLEMFTHDPLDKKILLCHFSPNYVQDHEDLREPRYANLQPTILEDEYLLHAHTHSEQHITANNVIHVGVDAIAWDYKPVSLDTIKDLLLRNK